MPMRCVGMRLRTISNISATKTFDALVAFAINAIVDELGTLVSTDTICLKPAAITA